MLNAYDVRLALSVFILQRPHNWESCLYLKSVIANQKFTVKFTVNREVKPCITSELVDYCVSCVICA